MMQGEQHSLITVYKSRWLGLGVLVLCEYLLVSYLFDSQPLRAVDGWWSQIGFLGRVAPIFFLGVAAAGLLRGRKIWQCLREVNVTDTSNTRFLCAICAHGIAYMIFLAVSYWIFREGMTWQAHPQRWILGWLASGGLAAAFLWPAFFPRALSGELLRMLGGALLLGMVVGLLAWRAGLYTEGLWTPLQKATLGLVAGMLKLMAGEIVYLPAEVQVGTPTFWVTVAPVCSGYEGIGLISVFIAAYVICFRKSLRFPQVLLLFPLSMLIAFLCNGLRITALILIGSWFSPEVAMGGFHSKAGTIFFCAIALGIVYLSNRMPFFSRTATAKGDAGEYHNPTAAYLMPLMSLLAVGMLGGLFLTGGFNYLYPLRIPVVLIVCWCYRTYFRSALDRLRAHSSASWFDLPAIGCGVAVFVMWMLLEPSPDALALAETRADLQALAPLGYFGWIAARIIGSVLLVPVVEELFFRGYLMRRLISADFETVAYRTFTSLSFLGSSLAFGVLHQRMLAGTLAGMAFAGILYRRGQLRDAIVAHAVANALIAVAVLGFGRWELWL